MVKLTAIGHLGKDCTINQVNGKNVINFSIASTEKWKDSGGAQQEKTTWVECAYWTDKTTISQYLKKGVQVYVEGSAEIRTWQSQTGSTGASLTCRILNIQLLGSKQEGSSNQQASQAQQTSNQQPAQTSGGLPF